MFGLKYELGDDWVGVRPRGYLDKSTSSGMIG